MDASQVAQPNNTVTSSPAPQQGTSTQQALTSDFETFLRMLTTQAQNQDPLEPLDSSEYAAQLAQFSMVEQQTKTNNMLESLVNKLSAVNMNELSNWIGMEARAFAPGHFNGAPITVSAAPVASADAAFLIVRDQSGSQVDRVAIPISADPVIWDGVDDAGNPVQTGAYSFAVQSLKNGQVILEEAAPVYNKVIEAQIQNGEVVLILEGGDAILASAVSAVRA